MRRIDATIRTHFMLEFTCLVFVLGAVASADDDKPPKVVKAPDAQKHIDERCIVEMTVQSSKNAAAE